MLEEAIRRRGGSATLWSQAFLAMAHWRLGHHPSAHRRLNQLAGSTPKSDPNSFWINVERDVLRREAESLIRLDPSFPPDPFPPGPNHP